MCLADASPRDVNSSVLRPAPTLSVDPSLVPPSTWRRVLRVVLRVALTPAMRWSTARARVNALLSEEQAPADVHEAEVLGLRCDAC